MPPIYRVFRRTENGTQIIAEIRGREITGLFADLVRERLIHYGYPAVGIEEALRRFRSSNSNYIGFERIQEPDE